MDNKNLTVKKSFQYNENESFNYLYKVSSRMKYLYYKTRIFNRNLEVISAVNDFDEKYLKKKEILKFFEKYYKYLHKSFYVDNKNNLIKNNYFYLFGIKYFYQIQNVNKKSFIFIFKNENDLNYYKVINAKNNIQKAIDKFLEDELLKLLKEKLLPKAFEKLNAPIALNKIKLEIKTKISAWGINSQNKTKNIYKLIFNLDLYMFPKEVIYAIVVHEVCHYFQRNHSRDFYKLVTKEVPNYFSLLKVTYTYDFD
ncbi:M48 family metallopeptidase [Mycoplasmopsis synoviae]|uniref:M48 family metallopeptidase n=2 Tax=Mycoplasmopsis synoviae TaxID=2109 RepID=A0AAQ2TCW6_MYCSY|nr:M48 family metallopeptidase [Mycoplasmopsis synoviae]AKJ20893.1 Zinc metalloprotease [Mycoplasmopsis synoviae]AQU48218.1 Zinc metalloprotease [Mycoplasmopsis synoviae]AWL84430.1 hypothetical protein MSH_03465 [Mycoplasmopsis synoviae]QLE14146.1 hypothetical protein DEH79_03460 [Mycoplasmopsis synoviae]UZF64295.1 M48 family metallopeptidase [Mycoplasmopsis synoviae]